MGTFYLGLSMAGTVSTGTYTGGTLVELDARLAAWQKVRQAGVSLRAIKAVGNISIGDIVHIAPEEMPEHLVKIKTMTGASGGGVSAGLYAIGLSVGNQQQLLKEIWESFDVKDFLDTNDLSEGSPVYSLLNVKPIENLTKTVRNQKWTDTNHLKDIEYIDENVEIFMTLASLEGIPYDVSPARGGKISYGKLKTHLDYIKFNLSKNGTIAPQKENRPYAHNLVFRNNHFVNEDLSWRQLIDSCPATAAFPFGFKPRSLRRFRNEYVGKLFYHNYTNYANKLDYSSLIPTWPDLGGVNNSFEMEYVDGGTFNNDPNDLARASLIDTIGNSGDLSLPSDGVRTNASVILIDPLPSISDTRTLPGDGIKGVPSIPQLIFPLVGALIDQGRFRPDWIERATDNAYYSRFIISPIRRDKNNVNQEVALAGSLLGAFSGFLDSSFREHDYNLGRYNTYQFLNDHFIIPVDNQTVNYCNGKSKEVLEKYEAIGWYKPSTKAGEKAHCQIIPRTEEPNLINSLQQPAWPTISKDIWEKLEGLAIERAKELLDTFTNFNRLIDKPTDFLIWKYFGKDKVEDALESIAKDLVANGLLRK